MAFPEHSDHTESSGGTHKTTTGGEQKRASRGALFRQLGIAYLVGSVCLVWGFCSGYYEIFPFRFVKPYIDELEVFIGNRGLRHVQKEPSKFDFSGLVRRDTSFVDPGFVLMSRFSSEHGQVVVELVRAMDFGILHRWVPPIREILDSTGRDGNANRAAGYRAQHPLLLPDGGLVFHSGEGPLVNIDRHGAVRWIVNKHFHHSIELDCEGRLVVPVVIKPSVGAYPGTYRDDGYAVVTMDGELLEAHSVCRILMRNWYRGLLLGVGEVEFDPIHLNDAQPVCRENGLARPGDVLLSSRHLSSVMLYRPSTDSIVWLRNGPWLGQHDVNVLGLGWYSVFGNNVLREDGILRPGRASIIYLYNAVEDAIRMPFGDVLLRN